MSSAHVVAVAEYLIVAAALARVGAAIHHSLETNRLPGWSTGSSPVTEKDMRRHVTRHRLAGLVVALLLAQEFAAEPATAQAPVSQAGVNDYRRKLEAYTLARQKFEQEASAYWTAIADKRRARNAKRRDKQDIVLDDYVLTQPPVYSGPAMPVDPSGAPEPAPRVYVPVVADFLTAAKEHFDFVPQRPRSEIEFKRAYAKVAAAAGITRDQAVRIYGFEVGGNGTYDTQAGLEHSREARAISTALGYNQLLNANSVNLMSEQGDHFIKVLKAKAVGLSGAEKAALEKKIGVLARMVAFCRTVPNQWSEQEKLANTPQGLGVHAMNLDIDVGPLLQTHKLLTSIVFARSKGHKGVLSAAELEMMNLTGDGNGFDIVTMPEAMREQVPTANFFRRSGYERNPVAIRNNVVAKLLAVTNTRMDRAVTMQGARDLGTAF
jgi:hypothetical protein